MDYAIALKFDKFEKIRDAQLTLFRVMCMIGDHWYQVPTALMLMIQQFQRAKKLPLWDMLAENLGCAIEEAGEILYAILSRCVVGDTNKAQFAHMQKMFQLLPTFRQTVSDFEDDLRVSGGGSGYIAVSKKSDEVKAVASWAKAHIRKIIAGSPCMYVTKTKQRSKGLTFRNIVSGNLMVGDPVSAAVYMPEVGGQVKAIFSKAREQLDTYYGEEFVDIWKFKYDDAGECVGSSDDDGDIGEDQTFDSHRGDLALPAGADAGANRPSEEEEEEKHSEGDSDVHSDDQPLGLTNWSKIQRRFKKRGEWHLIVEWEKGLPSEELESQFRSWGNDRWVDEWMAEQAAKKKASQKQNMNRRKRRRKKERKSDTTYK